MKRIYETGYYGMPNYVIGRINSEILFMVRSNFQGFLSTKENHAYIIEFQKIKYYRAQTIVEKYSDFIDFETKIANKMRFAIEYEKN